MCDAPRVGHDRARPTAHNRAYHHRITRTAVVDIVPIVVDEQETEGFVAKVREGRRMRPNWVHSSCFQSTHTTFIVAWVTAWVVLGTNGHLWEKQECKDPQYMKYMVRVGVAWILLTINASMR